MNGTLLPDPTVYGQLIGSNIYLRVTHLDIAYAVHFVISLFLVSRSAHYGFVPHNLRYVKGTYFHVFHFWSDSSHKLRAYFDVYWEGDPTNQCAGYCIFFGDSFISWRIKKQMLASDVSLILQHNYLL